MTRPLYPTAQDAEAAERVRAYQEQNRALHAALVSRVKIMASLDIAEKRLPQDGRIALKLGDKQVDVRVSTLPTIFGEKVVLIPGNHDEALRNYCGIVFGDIEVVDELVHETADGRRFLLILAFPAITIALFFLQFDRFFGTNFYQVQAGGDPLLWQHLFWVFGHPEVYILILPAFGLVSEVLPTHSRKPLFGYNVMAYSGIMIGFLGFGVWAHHMFAVGMGATADTIFSMATMLIGIPTGVKIFNWIATMWGGQIRFTSAMLFSIGFVAMFIIGGLSGVSLASARVGILGLTFLFAATSAIDVNGDRSTSAAGGASTATAWAGTSGRKPT